MLIKAAAGRFFFVRPGLPLAKQPSMPFSRREFISNGAAGIAWAIAPRRAEPGSMPVLRCLFQGDSITDGNRGRSEDPNHIMGHGYAFSVASRIGADFPEAGHRFFNRGISGNTVADLAGRWQQDTLDLKPNLLSILVGINDAYAVVTGRSNATDSSHFENTYRDLLDQALRQDPNMLLVLALPFVFPVGDRKQQWANWEEQTKMRADIVRKLAEERNAVLVDYPAVFEKATKRAPAAYWIWDGIHPTVPGHELMARTWIKAVAARIRFLKHYRY